MPSQRLLSLCRYAYRHIGRSFPFCALLLWIGTGPSLAAGEPTGACCSPTGVCFVTTEQNCDDGGREYLGDGTDCDPNPCDALTGACCFPDGSCEILEIDECAAAWGIFQGDEMPCDPTPCTEPIGACCLVGNLCSMSNWENCFFGDGVYQGDGTSCEFDPCDPTASIGDGSDTEADLAATGMHLSLPTPNPTAGPARIVLELAESGTIRVSTIDVTGGIARTELHQLESGRHELEWTTEDARGSLPAGVYYIRVEFGESAATRKLLVIR